MRKSSGNVFLGHPGEYFFPKIALDPRVPPPPLMLQYSIFKMEISVTKIGNDWKLLLTVVT